MIPKNASFFDDVVYAVTARDEGPEIRDRLLAPENRDVLVTWLVEAGVIEHEWWAYPKAYWCDEEAGLTVRVWDPADDARDSRDRRSDFAVPMYRVKRDEQ